MSGPPLVWNFPHFFYGFPNCVLNLKALVGALKQEKALVGAFSLLSDCEIFANLRLKL